MNDQTTIGRELPSVDGDFVGSEDLAPVEGTIDIQRLIGRALTRAREKYAEAQQAGDRCRAGQEVDVLAQPVVETMAKRLLVDIEAGHASPATLWAWLEGLTDPHGRPLFETDSTSSLGEPSAHRSNQRC